LALVQGKQRAGVPRPVRNESPDVHAGSMLDQTYIYIYIYIFIDISEKSLKIQINFTTEQRGGRRWISEPVIVRTPL